MPTVRPRLRRVSRPHHHVRARPDLPQRVEPEASALVVGGGIAGVSAALVLAERGVKVELLEAAPHLGGRLGTWDRRLADGSEVVVEHGYHGFFRQYYTLRDILRRLDPDLGFLRDVGGYPIASRPSVGWEPEDFTALPRTPLLNLVALVLRSPSFKLGELRHVNADEALAMLHYDPVRTYAEHDHRSAAELLDSLGFSDRGRAMLFEVFAHSFFNVEQRYSAAEFLAMCHFYFTANPEGLGHGRPDRGLPHLAVGAVHPPAGEARGDGEHRDARGGAAPRRRARVGRRRRGRARPPRPPPRRHHRRPRHARPRGRVPRARRRAPRGWPGGSRRCRAASPTSSPGCSARATSTRRARCSPASPARRSSTR